jgi:hypothetical protein
MIAAPTAQNDKRGDGEVGGVSQRRAGGVFRARLPGRVPAHADADEQCTGRERDRQKLHVLTRHGGPFVTGHGSLVKDRSSSLTSDK